MSQDELKRRVAQAALERVLPTLSPTSILGVGTGSTANHFIDLLAPHKDRFYGAVSSSEASAARLAGVGVRVLSLGEALERVAALPVYVDGADEVNPALHLVKGGGGALTREKIVAAASDVFICIVDSSKQVPWLGRYPLPLEVLLLLLTPHPLLLLRPLHTLAFLLLSGCSRNLETTSFQPASPLLPLSQVIPMARPLVSRAVTNMGGRPVWRQGFVTDNGNEIVDVHGLQMEDAVAWERRLNDLPGVVTVGLFALRPADVLLVGRDHTVEQIVNPTGRALPSQ